MPRKVFVAGEILTAADVNTNLMDQSVMVFDDDAARATAIPTPVEGMVTYLKDANQVQAFTGSAFTPVGGILQVVSVTKTDTFVSASTSFVDITGLAATITPTFTSSKILMSVSVSGSNTGDSQWGMQFLRDSTVIAIGDAAGSRTRATIWQFLQTNTFQIVSSNQQFLDSPSTASSVTYKVQGKTNSSSFTINRTGADVDGVNQARTVSTITLMEVAG